MPEPAARARLRVDSPARSAPRQRRAAGEPSIGGARRSRPRSGWVLVIVVIAASLVFFDASRGPTGSPAAGTSPTSATTSPAPDPLALVPAEPTSVPTSTPTSAPTSVVQAGTGTLAYAETTGTIAGAAGQLRPYRVAVEGGLGVTVDAFAAEVEAILADPRSWTASGEVRLQRVPSSAPADFTVILASPVTSETICREEWLETEQYTNCRLSDGRVVINLARWLTAVPDYGAPVSVYRVYAVNHEVGHQLGQTHELCPAAGQPAPVMQQQTLSLQGCTANGWPYLGGVRYRGPPGPF